jgi:hypothetical protein
LRIAFFFLDTPKGSKYGVSAAASFENAIHIIWICLKIGYPIPSHSGWWLTYPSDKYKFVNGKDDIPYIMENKKCLRPPTSIGLDGAAKPP